MKIPQQIDLNILDTYHLEDLKLVHAIAELVDNSIGSYYRNKESLKGPLIINITCSPDKFTISDNAYGISQSDFQNALVLGKSNTKTKIDNDFGVYGVGLKRSILWIGRTTEFISNSFEDKKVYSLTYPKRDEKGNFLTETELVTSEYNGTHGLTISISDLHFDNVQGFNPDIVDNLKINLGFIYYKFLETQEVYITINTQKLSIQKREILYDRFYDSYQLTGLKSKDSKYCLKNHTAKIIEWKIPVNQTNGKYSITGWLGIKRGAPKSGVGIYVFREKRGILGIPPAAPYNPYNLKVGDSNYLRLIGEIEIHGFKKPTMGNALPEISILTELLKAFKQDVSFERIEFKEDLLYKFFTQLNLHKVGMIDSSPCQKTTPVKMEDISNPQHSYLPSGDAQSTGPTISYLKSNSLREPESIKKEEFNFTINGINLLVNIEKSQSHNLEYSKDGNTVYIYIKSNHQFNASSLKFICHYILLFDEANPILNKPKEFLKSILPL